MTPKEAKYKKRIAYRLMERSVDGARKQYEKYVRMLQKKCEHKWVQVGDFGYCRPDPYWECPACGKTTRTDPTAKKKGAKHE